MILDIRFVKIGVFVGMLLTVPRINSQTTEPSLWEENLEQLAMEEEEETHWEEELEALARRQQEPLNLNVATRKQLEQFPFLTDLQIENIQAYLYIHGQMQTIYELQLVGEMDKRSIERLLPFVCVQPVEQKRGFPAFKNILKYGKHEILTRLDVPLYTRKGYQKNYLGPPLYHSLRYNFHYSDYLDVGLTAEKDAGEPLLALHNRKGYDYYSFYFLLKELGRLKTLAVGNYRLSFGQGLALSTDFRMGKSFSLNTSEYRTGGIRRHSSTDEYNYFRGAAIAVELLPALQLSAFYSHRTLDGTVEGGEITSIYKTGLHRTQKEADKRDAFALQTMGGNLTYDKNRLKVGATGLYYFFDRPYEPDLRKYARYNLHGNHFYNLSIDYKYRLGRFAWVGEAAMGKQGYALLNQLRYQLTTDYKLLLIHRYYSHDYWALFGRSFGESSTPQNENGWYLAAEATPLPRWKFFASLDLFSFPWWKYRISKPSQGVDGLFQAVYSPRKDLSMYANYRYKRKERDVAGSGGATILPTHHHRARYRLTYAPGAWKLQTTVDYNRFHAQGEQASQGAQCSQSAAYAFPHIPLSVSAQGTYFRTDDYDSRIYAYEKGLLNTFYVPSFYGQGFRYSAHLRYDVGKALMLLVKWGQTIYLDRQEIGSGNDLIAENKKTDVQMQVRVKF